MSVAVWLIENAATFVELLLCSVFCGTFLPRCKPNPIVRVAVCIAAALILYIANTYVSFSPVIFVSGIVLLIAAQAAIFYTAPVRAALLACLYPMVIMLADSLVGRTISFAAQIPLSETYQEQSIYRMLCLICSKTMLMILTLLLHRLFRRTEGIKLRYLLAVSALTAAMLLFGSVLLFTEIRQQTVSSVVSILFFGLMLITLLTMYFGTFALLDRYQARQQAELADMKNKMLEQSMQETEQTFLLWKTSLHDHKHRLAALKVMADSGDLDAIRAFLDKENVLFQQKLFYYKTGNDTVDTILSMKQHTAESKQIPFMIHAVVPERCPVSAAHFAASLGNLLDNAMEAAEHAEQPFIEVKIGEVKGMLLISVSNAYDPQYKPDKDKTFHGIGLRSVRRIVSEYGGDCLTQQDGSTYYAKIMLPLS